MRDSELLLNETLSTVTTQLAYFTLIDYTVFGVILACSLAIGLYFGFFSDDVKTADDYLMGGHKMKALPIAISLVASQLSALSIMTVPSEIYSFGWQYAFLVPTLILITLATNYQFLPVFYHNSIDNCYAYLEMRFSKTVRTVITLFFLAIHFFFLPIILYIPSLAFVEVTKHNIHVVNAVVCSVCIIYTMLGGIKAVVWTDVLQAGVMVGSVVLVAIFGISKVGGLGEVYNRAVAGGRIATPEFSFDPTLRTTFWNVIFATFFMWTCHVAFSQTCVQRLVSLPSLAAAKRSMVYFCIGVMFIMTFNCGTGIIMYAYYYECDPVKEQVVAKYDQMVPRFVQDVVGSISGMPGVFISCVFSASLSTVSASLHSLAGVVYNDFIRPMKLIRHNDTNANRTMRVIIMVVGTFCVIAGLIVEKFKSIFQVSQTVAGMSTGAVFGVFTLGMLYPWANKTGVLWGMVISMISVLGVTLNAQFYAAQGKLNYEILPTSIEGCINATIVSALTQQLSPPPRSGDEDVGFAMYKISFFWYSSIGVVITWISAMLISYFTGGQDFNNFDINLLSPCVQNWVPQKYRHTELTLIKTSVISRAEDTKKNKIEANEWAWKEEAKPLNN